MSRSVTTVTMYWLALAKEGRCAPSRLMAGGTPLAYGWVVVRSTIRTLFTSSTGMCHDGLNGWAVVIACLTASLLHHCATSYSVLAY
jgi:hypothetical protein